MTQGSWPEERTVHTIRDLEPSGSRESEEVLGSAAEHLEAGREQRLRGSQEWMPEADSTFSFQVKVSSPGGGISDAAPSGRGQAWGQRSLAHWLELPAGVSSLKTVAVASLSVYLSASWIPVRAGRGLPWWSSRTF